MTFTGFTEGKQRLVPLPGTFFTELLPQIDNLWELKVTLYAFWLLDHMEGAFRYITRSDFNENNDFLSGFSLNARQASASLDDGLQRAVKRGTLLRVELEVEQGVEKLYFLNSPRGRAAVHAIERGEWRYTGDAQRPVDIREDVPNIYRLYEENIGALTPMIAEELKEAEDTYPAEWISDAFRIAVENNVRNWRYVSAILTRWKEKGRDERKNRRDTEKDRRRYTDWEESEE
jgi:DNA replication protein